MVGVNFSVLILVLLLNFMLIMYLTTKIDVDTSLCMLHILALSTSLQGVCLLDYVVLATRDVSFLLIILIDL